MSGEKRGFFAHHRVGVDDLQKAGCIAMQDWKPVQPINPIIGYFYARRKKNRTCFCPVFIRVEF
jgi:hypothetical protein